MKTIKRLNFNSLLKASHWNWSRLIANPLLLRIQSSKGNENSNRYNSQYRNVIHSKPTVESVHDIFKSVATKYDKMNDVMSFGIHRYWKDLFVHMLHPTPGIQVLDVAGGTGDIAFRILKYIDVVASDQRNSGLNKNHPLSSISSFDQPNDDSTVKSSVVLSDINKHMLDVAKSKAKMYDSHLIHNDISFLCGDAAYLPIKDNTFDAYTIVFGLRNVIDRQKALTEAYRVLKPGGRFLCMEFSHVTNQTLKTLYDVYSFQVIPVMGQVIAGDWQAYQYLIESIRNFPDQETLCQLMETAGFSMVNYTNLSMGIAAIHSGFKL